MRKALATLHLDNSSLYTRLFSWRLAYLAGRSTLRKYPSAAGIGLGWLEGSPSFLQTEDLIIEIGMAGAVRRFFMLRRAGGQCRQRTLHSPKRLSLGVRRVLVAGST